MERRKFIRSGCNLCLLGAAGLMLPQIIGCSPAIPVYKTAIDNNIIQVPLALFEKSKIQYVRPKGWFYDIAVEKKEDNSYAAFLLKCTHQENQLTATSSGFHCSLHGSQFDIQGKVKKGPAEYPLKSYSTLVNQSNLTITITT